jgi:hypothetical protein
VGKTAVLGELPRHYARCAVLDADDVWRTTPFDVSDDRIGARFEGNVISVLRSYLEVGFPIVFLGWVLANPQKVERLLEATRDLFDSSQLVYLSATPECLNERSRGKQQRGLDWEYALSKLRQIEALPSPKVDTTDLDSAQVAERIVELVASDAS